MITMQIFRILCFNLLTEGYEKFTPNTKEVKSFFGVKSCPTCHQIVNNFDAYRTRYICRVFGICETCGAFELNKS